MVQHDAFGAVPVQYSVTRLPDDPDGQVAATIGQMRRYAREDAGTPEIQREIRTALRQYPGVPAYDAVFHHVKSKTSFRNDVDIVNPILSRMGGLGGDDVVETLIRPRDMAVMPSRMGDCDDYSMYGASMLLGMGYTPHDVMFVTVAADPQAPGNFSHVYLAVFDDERKIPLDISHGQYAGWEVPRDRVSRREEWSLANPIETAALLVAAAYGAWRLMRGGRG